MTLPAAFRPAVDGLSPTTTITAVRESRGRVAGLDGTRGLAVLLVVTYHAGLPVRYGGVVGVTIFFVLSGYLITAILNGEHERNGRISLRRFYLRRALRLVPALLVAVAVMSLVVVVTHDPQLHGNYWLQVVAALTYTMDFFAASPGASLPVWSHTWSLAVEEQFYLVWPVLLIGALALTRSRRQAARVVAAAAVLAVGWRIVASLTLPTARVYNAPDTAAYALLLGCALALMPRVAARVPVWVGYGAAALVAGVALFPRLNQNGSGGTVELFAGLVAGLLAVPIIAAAPRMRLLAWRPLVFLGTISYGVYLWHWPFLQVHPFGHVTHLVAVKVALVVAATGVAYLSFRFVEQPILAYKSRRFESP
jgi:peptidoglycan/LPS O-acetylase OafA/YrhL